MGKHLGAVSLALGVGLFLLNTVAWIAFGVAAIDQPTWGHGSGGSLVLNVLGGLAILTVLGYLVGLGLGIAGLVRGGPGRVVAGLGTAVNGLLLLGVALLAALALLGISA